MYSFIDFCVFFSITSVIYFLLSLQKRANTVQLDLAFPQDLGAYIRVQLGHVALFNATRSLTVFLSVTSNGFRCHSFPLVDLTGLYIGELYSKMCQASHVA